MFVILWTSLPFSCSTTEIRNSIAKKLSKFIALLGEVGILSKEHTTHTTYEKEKKPEMSNMAKDTILQIH